MEICLNNTVVHRLNMNGHWPLNVVFNGTTIADYRYETGTSNDPGGETDWNAFGFRGRVWYDNNEDFSNPDGSGDFNLYQSGIDTWKLDVRFDEHISNNYKMFGNRVYVTDINVVRSYMRLPNDVALRVSYISEPRDDNGVWMSGWSTFDRLVYYNVGEYLDSASYFGVACWFKETKNRYRQNYTITIVAS
jgi:hypothetical protein